VCDFFCLADKARQNAVLEERTELELPAYEPPRVVTYQDDELLAELGPAQACSFGGSVVGCDTLPWEPWRVPGPPG